MVTDAMTDMTPIHAEPVVSDAGHRQFLILVLLARGVRLHEAGPWLAEQNPTVRAWRRGNRE